MEDIGRKMDGLRMQTITQDHGLSERIPCSLSYIHMYKLTYMWVQCEKKKKEQERLTIGMGRGWMTALGGVLVEVVGCHTVLTSVCFLLSDRVSSNPSRP